MFPRKIKTDWEEWPEALFGRVVGETPKVGESAAECPGGGFQNDGQGKQAKNAFPSPSHVRMFASSTIGFRSEITWRPGRETDSAKAFNNGNVHPLFQIHGCPIE